MLFNVYYLHTFVAYQVTLVAILLSTSLTELASHSTLHYRLHLVCLSVQYTTGFQWKLKVFWSWDISHNTHNWWCKFEVKSTMFKVIKPYIDHTILLLAPKWRAVWLVIVVIVQCHPPSEGLAARSILLQRSRSSDDPAASLFVSPVHSMVSSLQRLRWRPQLLLPGVHPWTNSFSRLFRIFRVTKTPECNKIDY